MCEYLYAAFSLKREPDHGCTQSQAEVVRRWCSTLYYIARQEMEHLSLVNSMLTAIGATPWFLRPNFVPSRLVSPYFSSSARAALAVPGRHPLDLPYTLERFTEATIDRFVCGESPPAADVPPGMDPWWCFAEDVGGALSSSAVTARSAPVVMTSHLAAARGGISAGTVQELYDAIGEAFATLPDLFVPNPSEVVIPVEYNVFVFAVNDRASAKAAIDLILRQGEGLQGPWTYESHFRAFFEMRRELLTVRAADPGFEPALDLVDNPLASDITNEFTVEVFAAADFGYVTLLYMLSGLYSRFVPSDKYPHLSTALAQMSFAPTMTMLIRSLAEILVRLPIGDGRDAGTGPGFHISDLDRAILLDPSSDVLGDIELYLRRWDELTADLGRLSERAGQVAPAVAQELTFVYQSSFRITANLRRIYQLGYYSKFVSI